MHFITQQFQSLEWQLIILNWCITNLEKQFNAKMKQPTIDFACDSLHSVIHLSD